MEWVKTNCRLCGYLCGLFAQVEDGRVVALEPDPSRYPYDAAIVRGCRRCQSNLELLDHADRVNYPLKRVGARGSDEWQRISWGQALDEIAARLQLLADNNGPETLATSIGGPHSVYWPMHRFLNLFGSPNNLGIGQICWNPAIWVNALTFGWPLENELDPETTRCAIIWGMNPAESDNSLLWRTVLAYTRQGGHLIVVDPRQTRTARRADTWLPLEPGSDAALALGLLHVIIREKLYDEPFVTRWCAGFAELAAQVAPYTPQLVANLTGLTPAVIEETARAYAGASPATIITGRGIDQIGANSLPTQRAIACLRAVTGNVDVPGAAHLAEMPDFVPEIDLELSHLLPERQRAKQLGASFLRLQSYAGYERVFEQTVKGNGRLPHRYLTSAHPNLIWRAMLTGKPYPIRAMIVMGSNPLSAHADTKLIYQALKSLDLLVALELTRTPTSMLADYVLPIAGGLERPVLQTNAGTANIAYGGNSAVAPYYERRTDFDFWRELGLRMGQESYWPWQTFEESLDATLAPLGMSWAEFCETGLYAPTPTYRKFEHCPAAGHSPIGFATPSGKIELFSTVLDQLDAEPVPQPKPLCATDDHYKLRLISGARVQPFYASAFRQVEQLRQMHPLPLAEIGKETAQAQGLVDGNAIWVETEQGRALFKLKVAVMRENVVSVEYGWWYPELSGSDFESGVLISNANVLTHADFEECEPVLGQWQFNGLACRIYLAGPDELLFLNDRNVSRMEERAIAMEC
ncbi:MAG: molybdopterin-dependent oxidoreductase [Ardenticatenaceae bacterium]|nr:molybdopterin-dependent oxidoreductase [Ardenticatenaceae bacterium]